MGQTNCCVGAISSSVWKFPPPQKRESSKDKYWVKRKPDSCDIGLLVKQVTAGTQAATCFMQMLQ